MVNALHDLQTAQTQLNAADADKGGHRNNALNLVAQAISQVQAGIAVAASNGSADRAPNSSGAGRFARARHCSPFAVPRLARRR